MSRLDSFIRRMTAQRAILNSLRDRLADIPGPIFEFGLGSGRTYDHLREQFPDRQVIVFERMAEECARVGAEPVHLIAGDLRETATRFNDAYAAMIHVDIDTGHSSNDAHLATWLPALVSRLLKPGGYAASSVGIKHHQLASIPVPDGVELGRYHLARKLALHPDCQVGRSASSCDLDSVPV